ncbi:hypothetical protein GCM10008018_52910 [Paenibacillus marchantiophytorum]|uniref:Uncharacterized protein n=1 Tax=Paenibacillus marchantiophytorum TaxID=1619310 RepID=A0ABQ1F5S0_9BACL|nr:hypothetical protein GCM10008018_52910 [Paenibacillus marchantiophytorum]
MQGKVAEIPGLCGGTSKLEGNYTKILYLSQILGDCYLLHLSIAAVPRSTLTKLATKRAKQLGLSGSLIPTR